MAERTLLIPSPGQSCRDWLADNRGTRDLIVLDPAETAWGAPARLWLIQNDRPTAWRFYGSLEPMRSPHVLASTLATWMGLARKPILQFPPLRLTPLARQVALVLAELFRPDQLVVGSEDIGSLPWPIGPEVIALGLDYPEVVKHAQRKAKWLQLLEGTHQFELSFSSMAIEGARFGSGERMPARQLEAIGLTESDYVEASGGTALVISESLGSDEAILSRVMNVTHTHRVQLVNPAEYEGLLCAFARDRGDDFGFGRIRELNIRQGTLVIDSTAIPPINVPMVRLGSLVVDQNGNERAEHKPWSL